MAHTFSTKKPYEIRPRTFQFACAIVAAFPRNRHLDHASLQVWSQLVDSATSAGAHLEEAGGGGSLRHFLALNRGALREMRESHFWLRVLIATKLVGYESMDAHLDEANQLTAILTSIVKNTEANMPKTKARSR